MLCAGTGWEDDTDFLEKFRAKLISQRVPLSVSIALTDRCNLHCVHCYLNPKRAREGYHLNELSTDRFLTILDDITELGCLFLLFTGGEALLRRDFAVLYRRAKMNGMVVTVFTNGTTVTEEIADLFAELPPYWVEVSVYGASERTYQSITGDSSAYRRCLSGIERLVKRNVRVQVKTILMKLNVHEFEQIEEMAKGFSARFRFDGVIGTDSEGGKQPLQFRASPREIAVKEVRTLELREEWKG
ncbi:MAG: radical SAM protein, partial [Acidobacteria bacterium]